MTNSTTTPSFRLSQEEQGAIIKAFGSTFGENDHLWVFGSRANITKRGGDIDLYIETQSNVDQAVQYEMAFVKAFLYTFPEQKIDVVIYCEGRERQFIHNHARETGIQIL
jgi:hypothetical protein